MTNNGPGAATLTVTGPSTAPSTETFGGAITNGSATTALTLSNQNSGGTLTLSGANTYSGATTINGGTLAVTGTLSDASPVTVDSGGTLAGSGSVGSVNVANGGTFAPGANGNGSLSVNGNLTLSTAATDVVVLGSNSSTSVTVSGAASLGGVLKVVDNGYVFPVGAVNTIISIVNSSSLNGAGFSRLQTNLPGLSLNVFSGGGLGVWQTFLEIGVATPSTEWLGTGANANWNNAGNWTGAATPTVSALFDSRAATQTNIVVDAPAPGQATTIGTMVFNGVAPGSNFSFGISGGNALVLNGAGIIDQNVSQPPQFNVGNSGTLQFQNFASAADAIINTNNGGDTQFLGASTGVSATFNTGSGGTLDFSGTTATQLTAGTINDGQNGGGKIYLGSNALTVNGGSFSGAISDCGVGNASCQASVQNGNAPVTGGSLIMNGNTTLTLSGANTYSGGTTVNAGTLVIGNNSAIGAGNLSLAAGTTLSFATTGNFNLANNIHISGDPTFTPPANTVQTLSGVISDGAQPGVVAMQGQGTLVLSGANTYSGGTVISAGTLQVTNNSSVGSGTVTLDGGKFQAGANNLSFGNAFAINTTGGTVDANGNTLTLSGAIADGNGPGHLTVADSAGTGTVVLSAANSYSGGTTLNAGTLQLSGAGTLGATTGTLTVSGGRLDLNGTAQTTGALTLTGGAIQNGNLNSSSFGVQNGEIDAILSGSGVLTKTGSGTVTLTGTNTYTGATTINAGTLALSGSGSVASSSGVTMGGGTFDISGAGTRITNTPISVSGTVIAALQDGINASQNGSTIQLGGNTLEINQQGSSTFSGKIEGGGGLLVTGSGNGNNTLTLAGNSTYSGYTVVSGARTTLIGGATDAFSAQSIVSLAGGATLDLGGFDQKIAALEDASSLATGNGTGKVTNNGTSAATLTVGIGIGVSFVTPFSGTISDGNSTTGLTVTGADLHFVLSGNSNTYSGATTIDSGATLAGGVNNAFSANSAVTITSGGFLDLGTGNQTVASISGAGTITNHSSSAFGPITAAPVLTVDNGGSFSGTIEDGVISGVTTGLTLAGGTLTLSGNNTYTGATTVNAGTLALSGNGSISSSGSLAIGGAATFDISGVTTTVPNIPVTLQGTAIGTLQDGANATQNGGAINLGGNTLQINQQSSQTFSGAIVDGGQGGSLIVAGNGGNVTLTLAGNSTYSGNTIVAGTGTTLAGGVANAFSANSAVYLGTGTTLDLGGFNQQIASLSNLSAFVSGTGTGTVMNNGANNATLTVGNGASTSFGGIIQDGTSKTGLTKVGAGTLTLSGTNTYSGGTTINAGTLQISGSGTLGAATGALAVAGGTLDLGATIQTTGALGLTGGVIQNGTLDSASFGVQAGTISAVLGGTGALTKTGSGTVTLSGPNTYSGATTVGGGTLIGGAANTFSSASAMTIDYGGTIVTGVGQPTDFGSYATFESGATLDLGGFAQTINTVNLAGGTIQNGTLTSANGIASTGGTIGNIGGTTGVTTAANTTFLGGSNTYTGATTVDGGTLIGAAANTFSSASATTINGGGTVDLGGFAQTINTVNLAGGAIQNGTLTSAGGIASTGGTINNIGGSTAVTTTAGTTTLQGANGYTGGTNVSGGTLIGAATTTFSAASATTIDGGGTVDLGTFAQTIKTVNLAGGTIQNGALTSTNGITSIGGTINNIAGPTAVTTTAGTTTLKGTNSYTGASNVSGGTLTGGAATAFSAASATIIDSGGTVDLGGFAQTIRSVNLAGGTIQNGALTSADGITSSGGTIESLGGTATLTLSSGTTTLEGANSFSGATTVNGGALLSASSSSSSSAVTVNSNGLLAGLGSVGSVTINGGTLMPGVGALAQGLSTSPTTTPQTLSVNGNLVLSTASTYMVAINGSNYTTTSVTGTATIATGVALKISGTNLLVDAPYNIMTATSVITGTPVFASALVTPTTTYRTEVTNTGKQIQLTFLNPQLNPGVLPRGFSSFVNVVNNAPSNSPLQHLFGLSPGSLQTAASQLSGQSNSGGSASLANMQTSFSTTLLNPNLGNRGGAPGAFGPALGFAPETPLTPQEQAAYDAVTPHEPLDALMRSLNTDYSHSVWASGYGGYSKLTGDSNVGSPTATTGGGGVASGIDFRLGRDTVVGVALGGGGTSWSVSDGLGGGTSQIFQAGVYGSHRFGEAYVSGSLAYAFDWLHTNRNITVPATANLTADFLANGPTGRLETGYRFGSVDLGITPYIAGEFSALHTPSYSETTASGTPGLGLSYGSQTTTDVRAELGAWADKAFHLADGSTLWLRGRAGYAYDWWSNNTLSAQFLSLPTQSFTMTNITAPSSLGLLSLMSEIKYRNGVSLSGKFDAELGQNAYSFAGTGTFRYSW